MFVSSRMYTSELNLTVRHKIGSRALSIELMPFQRDISPSFHTTAT